MRMLTSRVVIVYRSYENIIQKEEDEVQAYCMKCRAKKEMKDAKAITMKNGKPATQGVCPTCGTKMFRIGKK
jgi:Zn finger protein HypA/HybF involved in hydrogenase expression